MIATKIQIYDKVINDDEWNFYLRGALSSPESTETRPSFLQEKHFDDIKSLSVLTPTFKTLLKEITDKKNENIWKEIMNSENPSEHKLPENLEVKLDMFQKMIVYKILR